MDRRKFPSTRILNVEKLKENRAMMKAKARPFSWNCMRNVKWEKGKEQRERQVWVCEREAKAFQRITGIPQKCTCIRASYHPPF